MDAIHNFSTRLLYTDICTAGCEWCYKGIISPFTRIYLITNGAGSIYMNQRRYELRKGDLFIIPKFTRHSYECSDFIEHYYVCFYDEMIGQQSIFNIINMRYKLPALSIDHHLFERLVQINSLRAIPHNDPRLYDNAERSLPFSPFHTVSDILAETENNGIIQQLLSRFFDGCNPEALSEQESMYHRLTPLINHINNNLSLPLKVTDLSEFMHLSPDHFTRVFKRIMGITANQYIQQKRIERAQALLITSRLTVQEVAESVGVNNLSQFSSLFKKITGYSPRGYVRMQVDFNELQSRSVGDEWCVIK